MSHNNDDALEVIFQKGIHAATMKSLNAAGSPAFPFVPKTRRIIFRLSDTHSKDDECDDYADNEYDVDDPDIPELPLHPNCDCYFEDADTGENLGIFGF